ncbi:MAG TPA: DUF3426 domain-containing protein [Desulfobacterales bacterium]|nr:DUF3426 domain-containing protein [Desulfobacterales bacterium]
MNITCEECSTTFSLDETILKPSGSKVQCSKCKNIFTAYPAAPTEISKESASALSDLEQSETDEQLQIPQEDLFEEKFDPSDLRDSAEIEEEPAQVGESKKVTDESGLEFDFDLSVTDDDETGDFDFEIDQEETAEEGIEELDLSELEEMLDIEEPETKPEVQEVEPDADIVPDSKEGPEKKIEELDIEPDLQMTLEDDVELSDIEDPGKPDSLQKAEPEAAPTSEELEFETATDDQEDVLEKKPTEKEEPVEEAFGTGISISETESPKDEKFQEPGRDLGENAIFGDEEIEPMRKKGVSSLLLVILLLAILGGGAYGAWIFLDKPKVTIPYISDFLKPKPQDLGNLKITPFDINSSFVDNAKNGRLFVITGQVKNSYPDTRNFVKVIGRLYTKGKKLTKTETIYSGNILSKQDLSNLELNVIKKRLTNKTVVNVEPGKVLPFMLVFNNLPGDLDEFTVEVKESSPIR